MFTIRAEIEHRNIPGTKAYQVFSAHTYRVEADPDAQPMTGLEKKSYKNLILMSDDCQSPLTGINILIGPDLEHYSVAYVMNDKGKTIDTIR
jgi:hypothetical protein